MNEGVGKADLNTARRKAPLKISEMTDGVQLTHTQSTAREVSRFVGIVGIVGNKVVGARIISVYSG